MHSQLRNTYSLFYSKYQFRNLEINSLSNTIKYGTQVYVKSKGVQENVHQISFCSEINKYSNIKMKDNQYLNELTKATSWLLVQGYYPHTCKPVSLWIKNRRMAMNKHRTPRNISMHAKKTLKHNNRIPKAIITSHSEYPWISL